MLLQKPVCSETNPELNTTICSQSDTSAPPSSANEEHSRTTIDDGNCWWSKAKSEFVNLHSLLKILNSGISSIPTSLFIAAGFSSVVFKETVEERMDSVTEKLTRRHPCKVQLKSCICGNASICPWQRYPSYVCARFLNGNCFLDQSECVWEHLHTKDCFMPDMLVKETLTLIPPAKRHCQGFQTFENHTAATNCVSDENAPPPPYEAIESISPQKCEEREIAPEMHCEEIIPLPPIPPAFFQIPIENWRKVYGQFLEDLKLDLLEVAIATENAAL